LDTKTSDEHGFFERKLDMLIQELECYSEAHSNFEKLETSYRKNISKENDLRTKLEKVTESEKMRYGIISQMSKEEKIDEINKQIDEVVNELLLQEKLVALIVEVFLTYELKCSKDRKRERFDRIIKEFSLLRIRKLEKDLSFWNLVYENATMGEGDEFDSKLLRGQQRITALPNVKITE
jgi:hypothetical protein